MSNQAGGRGCGPESVFRAGPGPERGLLVAALLLMALPAFLFGALPVQAQPIPSALAYEISAQDIRDAGVTRIGDILRLAPVFTDASTDGFRVDGSLFSSGPMDGRWRIAIDGVEVERSMLGQTHLEMLPVSVSRIARVVLEPPGYGPGGFSAQGWILIETTPPDGSAVRVMASVGNETGDPGPFRYTELRTPNVDRSGPTVEAEALLARTSGGAAWWASATLRADQAHLTDERLLDRVYVLYEGERQPRITLIHPRLEAGLRVGRWTHNLRADLTLVRDLYFLEALGAELPTIRQARSLGAFGSMEVDSATRFRYMVSSNHLEFRERQNRLNLALPWEEHRLIAGIGLTRGPWDLALDVRLRQSGLLPEEPSWTTPVIRGTRSWSFGAWTHRAGASISVPGPERRRVLPSLFLETGARWDAWRLGARASLIREAPEQTGSESFWLSEGLGYPDRGSSVALLADRPGDPGRFSLDVSASREPSPGTSFGVAGLFRVFSGLDIPETSLVPDSLFEPQYQSFRDFREGHQGRVLGARLWYKAQLGPHLRHAVHYAYRQPVFGSDLAFWQAFSPLPRTEMRYVLTVSPVPRTVLSFSARLRSSQSWPSIRTGPFSSQAETLPAAVRLDVAFSKALWGPRMRAFGLLRNLGTSFSRTHPLGPNDDLTLVAGVRLAL